MDGRRDATTTEASEPERAARLRLGIIDTDVSRSTAWLLVSTFLLLIYAVPSSQALLEQLRDEESSLLPLFTRAPTAENLRQLESDLELASFAKDWVQPRLQLLLTRFGRAGNQRALIGNDGFLFYTPGLTHLTGHSFIDADAIAARELAAREDGQPLRADPRPAILAFQRMLAQRGIALVLFPVPDKTMLQPRQLHDRASARGAAPVARNLGWDAFARELRAAGVVLFDPTPPRLNPDEPARFLTQDTHWTPAWMASVAGELARVVQAHATLPPRATTRPLHTVAARAERVGDLVDMLKLPDDQHWFRPQAVTVEQVQDPSGALWEADPAAAVLLLGDSFTNVFSEDSMGWGEAAGLAPQLALALGRSIDVIAQNDSGAFATRIALARELAAGEDRLAGKRVVVWELAARELSVGDWRLIDWQTGKELEP